MDIEQEIAIYQFGQEVYSIDEMLDQYGKLTEPDRARRQMELFGHICEDKPTQAEIEQALVDGDFSSDYSPCLRVSKLLKSTSIGLYLNDDEPEQDYKFLLHLFRRVYLRQSELEKGNLTNWNYWDLSDSHVVEDILTMNKKRIDEVYTDASFRGEFASIAKLRNADKLQMEESKAKPAPEIQTHFTFVTYDEITEKSINLIANKNWRPITLLANALERALLKRYALSPKHIQRLIWNVVERHLKETYNRELY
ncbi:hypothetical protein GCM10028805_48410 [Spirosoma harenae]